MLEEVDAIIFDLGGVILNIHYQKSIDAFREMGIKDFDRMYQQAHQNEIFDKFETGHMSPQEFRSYLRGHLPEGVTDDQIDDAWNCMLLDLPPKRIDLLRDFGSKYRIFLYSNTNAIHYEYFRKGLKENFGSANLLEELFEVTYYSHILGKRKPHPESFLHIIEENNLDASRTLFIDDSAQHIEGAVKAGLKTHFLISGDIVDIFG